MEPGVTAELDFPKEPVKRLEARLCFPLFGAFHGNLTWLSEVKVMPLGYNWKHKEDIKFHIQNECEYYAEWNAPEEMIDGASYPAHLSIYSFIHSSNTGNTTLHIKRIQTSPLPLNNFHFWNMKARGMTFIELLLYVDAKTCVSHVLF
jgi:hypothetical protein